jgi:hypothetical protein
MSLYPQKRTWISTVVMWDNGLIADDGIEQCRATLASGINAGMRYPYQDVSPPED